MSKTQTCVCKSDAECGFALLWNRYFDPDFLPLRWRTKFSILNEAGATEDDWYIALEAAERWLIHDRYSREERAFDYAVGVVFGRLAVLRGDNDSPGHR